MKVTSIVLFAASGIATATGAPSPDAAANALKEFNGPFGPYFALNHAVNAARSILDSDAAPHTPETKRAEESLLSAMSAVEKRDASPVDGRLKVRSAAAAIKDSLEKADLEKRQWWRWCGWVGQPCLKAKRDIDQLLSASEDILKSL